LCALFILSFFFLFTYTALFSYFTFDDGTAVVAVLRFYEGSYWQDLLHILTVFTPAFRPLTNLFWKPLYAVFGFNPLPYRIVVHLLLTVNLGVAYLLARRLELTREAAALTTLVFCYNVSQNIMLYDTCMVDMVMCFLFYALAVIAYVAGRQAGRPLGWRRTAAVLACYALALDSKEAAATLPGILLLYELFYRRGDFRDRRKALRVAGLLAVMFVAAAIYTKVKVADMSVNPSYRPNVTASYILSNMGTYLEGLLYLPENSVTAVKGCLIVLGFIAAGALVRSRYAIFGVLFFVAAMLPAALIPNRGGYAVYIGFFGLAMAVGAILAAARSYLIKRQDLETPSAVALFLCAAILLGWAHMVCRVKPGANAYFEWDKPKLVVLMNHFQRKIPEFPPNARILITDNVWGPDWGLMFLLRLMYHDKSLYVDRPNAMDRPPDPASYDLVVSYKTPDIEMQPAHFFGYPMWWELRGVPTSAGEFVYTSPTAHGAASRIDFSPQTVRSSQSTTVTVPGLSNVAVNAVYRIVSDKKSTSRLVSTWCTLDAKGSCTIVAPAAAGNRRTMIVDWIQPANQRWIFTGGVLTILE
jgi:hypothetical protein